MKTNYWKIAAAFVLGLAAMAACSPDEDGLEPPVFPEEVITNEDVNTTSETIEFTANLAWELSVPQSTIGFFWIEDEDGNKLNKISGEAGTHTVTIGISEERDPEKDITCDVTLTMGDESKVIATYTLLKADRTFSAYPCKVSDGQLVFKEEGGFDYESQAATSATFVYHEVYGYVMPFTFESTFAYDIKTPEWLLLESGENLGEKGTATVRVVADLDKLPAGTTEGKISICARNSDDELAAITVSVPDLSNLIIVDKAEVTIGQDGLYLGELESCELTVKTSANLSLALAGIEQDDYWYSTSHPDPEVHYSSATFNVEEETGEFIITRKVSVTFEPNKFQERKAYLLAMPEDVALEFNAFVWMTNPFEATELPEEFRPYLVTTFTQEGKAPVEGETLIAENAEISLSDGSDEIGAFIKSIVGPNLPVYLVNATEEFSLSSPTTEIWGMTFYNSNFIETPDLFAAEFFDGKLTISASKPTEGLVIFQTEGDMPFAAAWISYAPSVVAPTIPFELLYPDYVSGATLSVAQPDQIPSDVQYLGAKSENIYILTYTEAQPAMAQIKVPCQPDWGASYGNWDAVPTWWLTYESLDDNTIIVDMKEPNKVDFFTFQTGGQMYVLICTYKGASAGPALPEDLIKFTPAAPLMDPMDPSTPLYQMLYEEYGTANLVEVQLKQNGMMEAVNGSFDSVEVLGTDLAISTMFMIQEVAPGMAMIITHAAPAGAECILVCKKAGAANVVIHVTKVTV